MNKSYAWALAFSFLPSAVFAQFVGGPPPAGKQGADDKAAKAPVEIVVPGANPGAAAATPAPGVNRMFEAIDANGDGVISKAELAKAVAALKKLDADGDGNITLAEVSGPTGPVGPAATVTSASDQAMAQYDKNKDGRLTPDELPPEMAANFRMADANGDGAITRPELADIMGKMQNMFTAQGGGFPGGANQGQMGDQMMQQMMRYDRNGDGKLTADELPAQLLAQLQGADTNGDRAVDAQEMRAYILQMGQRAGRGGAFNGMPQMGNGVRRGGY